MLILVCECSSFNSLARRVQCYLILLQEGSSVSHINGRKILLTHDR